MATISIDNDRGKVYFNPRRKRHLPPNAKHRRVSVLECENNRQAEALCWELFMQKHPDIMKKIREGG